jgi:hypothetical protein
VTYTLEEATDAGFTTGKRTVYIGALTTATITARTKGLAYFYRVRTNKTGWASSDWTLAGNECKIAPAAPAGIVIPASDADGSYYVSWTASTTPGVTYVLEEATNAAFSDNLQALPVDGTRALVPSRTAGMIYYYRVKAQKAGFADSPWRNGSAGCKVGALAPPTELAIPASDADGSYAVSWSASSTPGVSYEVQEATNATFTLGLRTLPATTASSVAISGRTVGKTYYYRVRATKAGFVATVWVSAGNGCFVPIP